MVEEEDFINKIWPQNCGDNLKVIKKTSLKNIQHIFMNVNSLNILIKF